MNNNLLHNDNGIDYCVVIGDIGGPALLVRLNNDSRKYIVCQILEEHGWLHGNYLDDFETAYQEYRRIAHA